MTDLFSDQPGRLYVVATFLPLLPAAILIILGGCRHLSRSAREVSQMASWLDRRWRSPEVDRWGAWLSIAVMLLIAGMSILGMAEMLEFSQTDPSRAWTETVEWIRIGATPAGAFEHPTEGNTELPKVSEIQVIAFGYWIDRTCAILFAMVAIVSSMIFLFSLGYLDDELGLEVEDHLGHCRRRGRLMHFYVVLNLFVFAMFHLLIAVNLLQVFMSWELVGVCSYFLISFYGERPEAGWAANKAFIVNRVGDAGFLVALAMAWTGLQTLSIPALNGILSRGDLSAEGLSSTWHFCLALGLFLGCVGKSAQIPLQVWLPDAMAGPTPVSALIHAATMVAAGVYLIARCYPMFPAEVLLVIAYTGCFTLFVAATVACVQTDIKKVLAYSTVSQLGYMMLALGVGGLSAGLFHLLTHAFFKALLFLGAGSVIHALHHEQDLRAMGGLRQRMPITAATMLVGVLAISGMPFFSGWYSKEAILDRATRVMLNEPQHFLLGFLPLLTAGLTVYYMFRLWFLAFAGSPRHRSVFEQSQESPWVMTVPLLVLSVFSLGVGWGWPIWEPGESIVLHLLAASESLGHDSPLSAGQAAAWLHEHHGVLALVTAGIGACGFAVAYWRFGRGAPVMATVTTGGMSRFLQQGWYFDAVYEAGIRQPFQAFTLAAARFDKGPDDRGGASWKSVDGWGNSIGEWIVRSARPVRRWQTGRIRGYVAILGLTVVGMLGMLAILMRS
jgi:NADH-quinone oxidoreductase subunit L